MYSQTSFLMRSFFSKILTNDTLYLALMAYESYYAIYISRVMLHSPLAKNNVGGRSKDNCNPFILTGYSQVLLQTAVFKISAGPQTLTAKIESVQQAFLLYPIKFSGKIVLQSGKFQMLFWRLKQWDKSPQLCPISIPGCPAMEHILPALWPPMTARYPELPVSCIWFLPWHHAWSNIDSYTVLAWWQQDW